MIKIYLDSLDADRNKTFLKLNKFINQGTLAGGTALLLQINHRYSYDFDIFFKTPTIQQTYKKAKKFLNIDEKKVDLPNHITFWTKNKIQITFYYYQFASLYKKIKTQSIPLFHYKDIAADKAYTIGRRPMWRDYVDLFYLLKNKYLNLDKIISDAKRKFKADFNIKLFLEQLTYYKDIRNFKVSYIGKQYSPKQIQEFLKKQVLLYTKKKNNV